MIKNPVQKQKLIASAFLIKNLEIELLEIYFSCLAAVLIYSVLAEYEFIENKASREDADIFLEGRISEKPKLYKEFLWEPLKEG